ncbi:MAG: sterol desaturase family protein [Spirochaetales bacterium]|nr:sterol desaturase family protein [Spirochaetales bacterium]
MEKESIDYETRDEKGHWSPPPVEYAPLFTTPWKGAALLKWLLGWGGYLWPRHLCYGLLAFAAWYFLQPDFSETAVLSLPWIGLMLIRNLVFVLAVFGFFHLTLYILKVQGNRGKYHPRWQERDSGKFMFRDQVRDNMFRSLVYGVPIWTAWEVLYYFLGARGLMPLMEFRDNPVWFIAFFLIIPLWRETHFYFIHRLIHWKPLLRAVHSVHHKNPNCGPWSGLAMHPVEHLLYFSVVLIHFVLPSHPVHFFFNSQLTALTPAPGHTGFHGRLFGNTWPSGDYFHYLHHRYVSCNFGGGTIPWDKWLGRFFNGEGEYKTKKA